MHGCQWLKLEGLLRTSPDMHLLCLFGMTAKKVTSMTAMEFQVFNQPDRNKIPI